jgi:hypothetical protein
MFFQLLQNETNKNEKGFFLVLVLVLSGVFFTILTSFIGFIVTQNQVVNQRVVLDKSAEIAEAGLNYYKWYLAHFPNDVTNGTGLAGPYVHTYYDPEDGAIGEFSLDIASTTYCGDIASIEVSSTGYTYQDPSISRTVTARYAQPTVAEYAFIINSNVWAGDDRTIIGPYHSNQGIRMDGTNQSTVTSGLTDWTCTSSFGCSPSQTVDGVFTSTANANTSLFSFPSSPINFTDLTIDLVNMKDRAENNGGWYFGDSGGGNDGYHFTFNGDGTFTVRTVTRTYSYWGYSSSDGWQSEDNVIRNESGGTTYAIDPNCPLIYVEDRVWLEGVVDEKVTLAAADTDSSSVNPDIILEGDITYVDAAEDGLLAIAENNVLVGLTVPNDMEVNGIFVAQDGRYGRNHYTTSGSYDVLSMHNSYVTRNSLTMNGTIVSNGRVGTKWTSGGTFISGFDTRYNSYDRNLVDNPPPLVPNTSDVYEFTEWREDD